MMRLPFLAKALILVGWSAALTATSWGQTNGDAPAPAVSGNVGILWQSYSEDSLIGAVVPPAKSGYNAFANVNYNQGNFSAGIRYESYLNAIIGFPDGSTAVDWVTGLSVTTTLKKASTSPWGTSTTSLAMAWFCAPTN